jgi:hypothetical protein
MKLSRLFSSTPRLPLPPNVEAALAERSSKHARAAGEVLALCDAQPGPEPHLDHVSQLKIDFPRLAKQLKHTEGTQRREVLDHFEAMAQRFPDRPIERELASNAFDELLHLESGKLATGARAMRQAVDAELFTDAGARQHARPIYFLQMTQLVSSLPADERQEMVDLLCRLLPSGSTGAVREVALMMHQLPRAERIELVELLEPIRAAGNSNDPEWIYSLTFALAQTPREARRGHAEAMLRAQEGQVGELRHTHLENVMTKEQMSWTANAISLLLAKVGKPNQHYRQALKQIDAEISRFEEHRSSLPVEQQSQGLYRTRGPAEKTELEHARRVLFAKPVRGDYSEPLWINTRFQIDSKRSIGVGDLCGAVWQFVQAQPDAHERELMTHALITALAQCVEDDGHRVCDVGITQRLTRFLNKRLDGLDEEPPVTPGELLAAFGLSFRHELKGREPNLDELNALEEKAMRQADKVYAEEPELRALFGAHYAEFVKITYPEALGLPTPEVAESRCGIETRER